MDPTLEKWTWGLIVASAAAIGFTSACYALTPAVLALPVPLSQVPEALAIATEHGTKILSLGGTVGIPGDLVFAAAAIVVAMHARRGTAALGWALSSFSAFLFTVIDAMAARSLSPGPTFAFAKPLFDLLFVAGTFAFAAGTLLVFWPERRRLLAKAALGVGALGIVSTLLTLAGAPAGQLVGATIGLGVAVYLIEAIGRLTIPTRAGIASVTVPQA